jgi:Protein of unknown function (DUF5132)
MAGIDDLFKNGLGSGLAVAVGVAVLGPIVMPALARGLKPVVKSAIKGGIVAYGWGRESIAEMREYMEDTYAEAHAEMEHGEGLTAATPRGRGRAKAEGTVSAS